jgi:hypothetical protein
VRGPTPLESRTTRWTKPPGLRLAGGNPRAARGQTQGQLHPLSPCGPGSAPRPPGPDGHLGKHCRTWGTWHYRGDTPFPPVAPGNVNNAIPVSLIIHAFVSIEWVRLIDLLVRLSSQFAYSYTVTPACWVLCEIVLGPACGICCVTRCARLVRLSRSCLQRCVLFDCSSPTYLACGATRLRALSLRS